MTTVRTQHPTMITSKVDLLRLTGQLAGQSPIACDLEGDSLHHYQERVCLIQISTIDESYLIDPLTIPDVSPLGSVLADPHVRKVFHGADYDIRSLYRDFSIEVNNLFDTMVACQLLGEKEVGLAAVLKKRFSVDLDKRFQKADWSRRPLSGDMIDYAAKDTSLLIELHAQLERELAAKGRLYWLEEECELLSRVRSAPRNGEPFFLKFKGASRMDPRTLAVLEELLRFREEKARVRDVPPFKVIGNEQIRVVAEKKPRKHSELKDMHGLPAVLAERYGEGVLEAVDRGMAKTSTSLPQFPRSLRVVRSRQQEELLKRLKQWRETKAQELRVDAGLLANNTLLEAVADAAPAGELDLDAIPVMKSWQKKEFGPELLALVRSARI